MEDTIQKEWLWENRKPSSGDISSKKVSTNIDNIIFGYYYPYSGKLKILDEVYIRVFQPTAIGKKGSEEVCGKEKNNSYEQNELLDTNRDGTITKDEAAAPVIKRRDMEYK